jgi:hypothetical protein
LVRKTSRPEASRWQRKRLTALAAAAILAFGALPAVAADAVLAKFAGNWIGRGKYWSSPGAKPELVYCKISNSLVKNGSALEQKGRCAVASNSGPVKGLISATGDGTYKGSLESISTAGPAKLAGRGAVARIDLKADFIDRLSRQPTQAIITLIAGDGKYRLVSNPLGPDGTPQFVTTDIVFSPQ